MVIMQGEKRFIKIRTIVCGVIREDFTRGKPVQSKVWGQHFGEVCSSSYGFERIQRESERASHSPLSPIVEDLWGKFRLKGYNCQLKPPSPGIR